MKNFKIWLENNNYVFVDYSNFEKKIKDSAQDLMDYAKERKQSLKRFSLDFEILKTLSNYPNITSLLNNLKNKKDIRKASNDLYAWYSKLSNDGKNYVRTAMKHINDYEDSIDNSEVNEEEYKSWVDQIIEQTKPNMDSIKKEVETAIKNSDWQGSSVRIYPLPSEEYDGRIAMSPANSAYIKIGNKSAYFTLIIHDKGRSVDDIIEAGYDEEEFFSSNEEKSDYYTLIQEFERPGSSSSGKILTLYTARPVRDRNFYQNTTWLPANIFLSNSLNHVEGLADDLGSDERRDVYRVKINSKYLIKTLDGMVKYYMVNKDKSPVEYIGLY